MYGHFVTFIFFTLTFFYKGKFGELSLEIRDTLGVQTKAGNHCCDSIWNKYFHLKEKSSYWWLIGARSPLASSAVTTRTQLPEERSRVGGPTPTPQFHSPGLVQKETASSRAARKIRRSSWELKRLKRIDKLYLLLECNSKNLQRDFPASVL